ncbi:MAG: pyrimidine dimer DNA glycosylase/endonuclease V [Deferrisomatales bacterium]
MRLWSLHPKYLDGRGLVALWREGLLAKAVLEGRTRGYTGHPQLLRFRGQPDPVAAIQAYLLAALAEARARGYRFDPGKVDPAPRAAPIPVTTGQLRYEWGHLVRKLEVRDPARYQRLRSLPAVEPHPAFHPVPGPVEPWEVTK